LPANLNPSNRPVRTRMPGGVAGDAEVYLRAPMPIGNCRSHSLWGRGHPFVNCGVLSIVLSRTARLAKGERLGPES